MLPIISLMLPLIALALFMLTLVVFPPAIGTNLTEAPAATLGFVTYLFSPLIFFTGGMLAVFSRKNGKFSSVALIGLLINMLLFLLRFFMGSGIPG